MALIQSLIESSKYDIKCPYSMSPKGICVHNTANDATAKNEIAYMKTNNNQVSFHVAVDDNESIQAIPFTRNAWAAGDGGSGDGNRNFIHFEICYSKSGGARFINAEKRAAKEIAALLKSYKWDISKVKKHQDFSRKYCPHRTLDMGWQRFLNMISAELSALNAPKPTEVVKELYRVRKTWSDAASQVGAFSDLENAKELCNKHKGYSVFDSAGKTVYPTAPAVAELYRIRLTWSSVNSQKGAYSDLKNAIAECKKHPGYSVFNSAGKAVHTEPDKEYINIKPHVTGWAVYNQNGPYTLAHKIGELSPKKFGGLSYEVLEKKGNDVYIIQTSSFGKVGIWVTRTTTSASFNNHPLY